MTPERLTLRIAGPVRERGAIWTSSHAGRGMFRTMAASTVPRFVRVLALLGLAVGLLEVALQLNGQSFASELFGLIRAGGEAGPALDLAKIRSQIASPDVMQQREALRALVAARVTSAPSVRELGPELAAALPRVGNAVKVQYLKVLTTMGRGACKPDAILALVRNPDGQVRNSALTALSKLVERPLDLLPPVSELLDGLVTNPYEFTNGAGFAPELVDALMREALGHPELKRELYGFSSRNVEYLGARRPDFARWWVEHVAVRTTPETVLEDIGYAAKLGPEVLEWLAANLRDPDPVVAVSAAIVRLAILPAGVHAREVELVRAYVPHWAACEEVGDARGRMPYEVATDLFEVLPRLGYAPAELADLLVKRLRCKPRDAFDLVTRLQALKLFAPSIPKIEAAMDEALNRGDDLFWFLPAANYAKEAGTAGDRLIPLFIRALDAKPMSFHRMSLASDIAAFGPRARDALPRLKRLLDEVPPDERSWVQGSIDRIEGRESR